MKIQITVKDADGVGNSVQEAINKSVAGLDNLSEDEREAVADCRAEEIWGAISAYVTCQEYITIEIDTATGLAIVVPDN